MKNIFVFATAISLISTLMAISATPAFAKECPALAEIVREVYAAKTNRDVSEIDLNLTPLTDFNDDSGFKGHWRNRMYACGYGAQQKSGYAFADSEYDVPAIEVESGRAFNIKRSPTANEIANFMRSF